MSPVAKTRPQLWRRFRLTVELLEKRDIPSANPVTMIDPGNQINYDGDAVNLAISASDSTPGATLAYSATGLPTGLSIDSSTGEVTGTIDPSADTSSPYTPTFTASDGTHSANRTINWAVNYPVTMTSPGDQTNYDGDAVSVVVSASDAIGGALAYSATGLPAGLSIDSSTGIISGTIDTSADASGPYSITISASDSTYSASQTVNWAVNYPVTMTNPGDQTNYNNDQVDLAISASDATGGSLTYHATGLPLGLGIDPNTGAIAGAATIDGSPFTVTVTAADGPYMPAKPLPGRSTPTRYHWTLWNRNFKRMGTR